MLVLTLMPNEGIKIGDDVTIYPRNLPTDSRGREGVSLAFDAPREISIVRFKLDGTNLPKRKS